MIPLVKLNDVKSMYKKINMISCSKMDPQDKIY